MSLRSSLAQVRRLYGAMALWRYGSMALWLALSCRPRVADVAVDPAGTSLHWLVITPLTLQARRILLEARVDQPC